MELELEDLELEKLVEVVENAEKFAKVHPPAQWTPERPKVAEGQWDVVANSQAVKVETVAQTWVHLLAGMLPVVVVVVLVLVVAKVVMVKMGFSSIAFGLEVGKLPSHLLT